MKGYTPPKSTQNKLAKVRKRLRTQLKELTHAHEFYVNSRSDFLPNEIRRVHQAILDVKVKLIYPTLY